MIDSARIASIAARHGIPPSVLSSTLSREVPEHVLADFPQAKGDPLFEAEVVARNLAQSFNRQGTWQSALSVYYSGDPLAASNPESPASAIVGATMASASIGLQASLADGQYGSQGLDAATAAATFGDLIQYAERFADSGGVVTPDQLNWSRRHVASLVAHASPPTQPNLTTGGKPVSYGSPYVAPPPGTTSFGNAPFDPRYDSVSQGFGPTQFGMEPPGFGYAHFHTGVDYNVPDHSPLFAVGEGKVIRVQSGTWGPGGSEVTIRLADGSTVLYGHVSSFSVHEGDAVHPGQLIGTSGGAPGEGGAGMSTGAHLHIELRNPQGQLVDPRSLVTKSEHSQQNAQQASQPAVAAAQSIVNQTSRFAMQQKSRALPQKTASPKDVEQFAMQAKGAGITDPQHIVDTLPVLAPISRRLTGKPPTLNEVAQMAGRSAAEMAQSVLARPHSRYPEMTVGDYHRMYSHATLHSTANAQRMPYGSEIQRFVASAAGDAQLAAYYRNIGAAPAPSAAATDGADGDRAKAPAEAQPRVIPLAGMRRSA